jgi:arginine N-succinyltransferase
MKKHNLSHFNDYILRPIKKTDLTELCNLAKVSGVGFTSLPDSREALSKKIKESITSFAKKKKELYSEYYLFALEHLPSNKIVGVSAIEANVGAEELFYHYKIGKLAKASKDLDIRITHDILTLTTDLSNTTEICTLFLLPEHRHKCLGQLISRARFLFLKLFQERFPEQIIAEMRGISDEKGVSPFWNAIGKCFIGLKFPEADYIKGCGQKQFITDLIPETRIYASMLPTGARNAIGKVHKLTAPAKSLLEKEGFKFKGYVDLFDAGPTLHAKMQQINTFNNTKDYKISNINIEDYLKKNKDVQLTPVILSNKNIKWRASLSEAIILENNLENNDLKDDSSKDNIGGIIISSKTKKVLKADKVVQVALVKV